MVTYGAAGAATRHPPSQTRILLRCAPSLAAPASSIAPAPSPSAPPAASLSNLINSPQGDPLPPAAGLQAQPPGDAARGRGDPARGTPSPRVGARQRSTVRKPGSWGMGRAPRDLQGHPRVPPAPQPCSQEPRSPLDAPAGALPLHTVPARQPCCRLFESPSPAEFIYNRYCS